MTLDELTEEEQEHLSRFNINDLTKFKAMRSRQLEQEKRYKQFICLQCKNIAKKLNLEEGNKP